VNKFGGCLGSRTHTVQVLPGYSRLLSPHEVVHPKELWSEVRESNPPDLLGRQLYHQNFLPRAHNFHTSDLLKSKEHPLHMAGSCYRCRPERVLGWVCLPGVAPRDLDSVLSLCLFLDLCVQNTHTYPRLTINGSVG